ncbi:MAG: NfeD family protein [Asticcacaulis sp.]|nr:NfeD family protein [Asticcacaulis sp.]
MTHFVLMPPMGLPAFWLWLTIGILLLGAEVFLGTQWLLWSAAAAGVVAVVCLTNLPFGLVLQAAAFAILSVAGALLTRRFMKVPGGHDVNDPLVRFIGKQAEILSGFAPASGGERTGRVMFDGVEWPAVLNDGDAALKHKDRVIIERVHEGRLYIRPVG